MSIPKYAIFAGYNFRTKGGFYDIYDYTYTLDEAIVIYSKIITNKFYNYQIYNNCKEMNSASYFSKQNPNIRQVPFEWVHIVDLQKKEIILDSKDMKNSKL